MSEHAPTSLNKDGGRIFTSGQVAREFGALRSQIHSLSVKGLIPFQRTESGHRLYSESDIPTIREACEKAGYLNPVMPRGRSYDEFEEALAGIGLGTELCPLTKHQKEELFDWFRNSRPEPWPTKRGPEIIYDPNHGAEAKS